MDIHLDALYDSSFAERLYNLLVTIKELANDEGDNSWSRVAPDTVLEVESRLGAIVTSTSTFEAGTKQKYFDAMLEDKWNKPGRRKEKSESVDFFFANSPNRVTVNFTTNENSDSFRAATTLVKQRALQRPLDANVHQPNRVHYALRLGCSFETTVSDATRERKALKEFALHYGRERGLSGRQPPQSQQQQQQISIKECLRRGLAVRLRSSAPSQFDEYKTLKWTNMNPAVLHAIEGYDTDLGTYTVVDGGEQVVLGNLPGYFSAQNRPVSAFEFVIKVAVRDVAPIAPTGEGGEQEGSFTIVDGDITVIREKTRASFELDLGILLELTKTTERNSNNRRESGGKVAYEIEMERVISLDYARGMDCFRLARTFLFFVGKEFYGVKKEMDEAYFERLRANWDAKRGARNIHPSDASSLMSLNAFPRDLVRNVEDDDVVAQLEERPSHEVKRSRTEEARLAEEHYNRLDRSDRDRRAESLIYHMRSLNNFVKSVLIKRYFPSLPSQGGAKILDLACGKGADAGKFAQAAADLKTRVVLYAGVDIARNSLEEASTRCEAAFRSKLKDAASRPAQPWFVCADLGVNRLGGDDDGEEEEEERDDDKRRVVRVLRERGGTWGEENALLALGPPSQRFNLVSMQFAFHYMFATRDSAHCFFRTLAARCEVGAYFVATTVDPDAMLSRLLNSNDPLHVRILEEEGEVERCVVRFEEESVRRALRSEMGWDFPQYEERYRGPEDEGFGLKYWFTLLDEADESAVDAPEWLIPTSLLERLAGKYGFVVERRVRLTQFAVEALRESPENRELWNAMHVPNMTSGRLSRAEWAVASLYQVLALKKVEDVDDKIAKDFVGDEKTDMFIAQTGKLEEMKYPGWEFMTSDEQGALVEKILRGYM